MEKLVNRTHEVLCCLLMCLIFCNLEASPEDNRVDCTCNEYINSIMWWRVLCSPAILSYVVYKMHGRYSLPFADRFFWPCASSVGPFSVLALLVSHKKSLLRTMSSFSPLLSSMNFVFRSSTEILNPFWVNFCEWCKTGVQFHSFT